MSDLNETIRGWVVSLEWRTGGGYLAVNGHGRAVVNGSVVFTSRSLAREAARRIRADATDFDPPKVRVHRATVTLIVEE